MVSMMAAALAAVGLATTPVSAQGVALDRDTPTHRLDPAIDVPMLVIPTVIAAGNFLATTAPPPACSPLCKPGPLNDLDRSFAGLWAPEWALATDLAVAGAGAVALATLLIEEAPLAALQDAVVITEAVLWTVALSTVTKVATRRPRPFLYSDRAPLWRREGTDAGWSFFSGHVATAAVLTTATVTIFAKRDPNSPAPWVALAVGSALTTFVAIGRVQSGRHFPTDVMAGAAIGAAFGYLVPLMHEELEGWLVQARAARDGGAVEVGLTW